MFVVLTPFYNIAQGMSSTAQVAIIYTIHCANIRALTLELCANVFVGFILVQQDNLGNTRDKTLENDPSSQKTLIPGCQN